MIYRIASKTNHHVVEAAKLKMAKYQKESGLFLVEGFHLLDMAVEHKALKAVFTNKEIPNLDVDQYLVSDEIIDKLSATKSPQGVVAVCKMKKPHSIVTNKVLFLDDISDPGNLGTILRTALAFGYLDVIISSQSVSPYNDRAINASQGALLALNIVVGGIEILKNLQKKGYQVVATSLRDSKSLLEESFATKHIVVLGNESRGINDEILNVADKKVKIAIKGIESLNVAVAAGIVLYEINSKK